MNMLKKNTTSLTAALLCCFGLAGTTNAAPVDTADIDAPALHHTTVIENGVDNDLLTQTETPVPADLTAVSFEPDAPVETQRSPDLTAPENAAVNIAWSPSPTDHAAQNLADVNHENIAQPGLLNEQTELTETNGVA